MRKPDIDKTSLEPKSNPVNPTEEETLDRIANVLAMVARDIHEKEKRLGRELIHTKENVPNIQKANITN